MLTYLSAHIGSDHTETDLAAHKSLFVFLRQGSFHELQNLKELKCQVWCNSSNQKIFRLETCHQRQSFVQK